jgi:hypothetical protein
MGGEEDVLLEFGRIGGARQVKSRHVTSNQVRGGRTRVMCFLSLDASAGRESVAVAEARASLAASRSLARAVLSRWVMAASVRSSCDVSKVSE